MFKKILFVAAGLSLSTFSFAQKSKVNEAIREMEKAQAAAQKSDAAAEAEAYTKAKAAIDLAITDESTKDNAKTHFTKAGIYIGMQNNSQLNADMPYKEGLAALQKAMELDKKYEKDQQTTSLLANSAFYLYNDGIQTYNRNKFEEAFQTFSTAANLLGEDKDKRFMLMPVIDTIRAQSKMFMGYTAFYDNKFDVAIPLLIEAKNSPYLAGQETSIYTLLAQSYEKQGKTVEQLAVIEEGLKKFPDNKNIANLELNYYINSGQEEQMIAKLEEAAAKDPNNSDIIFNMGITYAGMANPSSGTPPANADELMKKAEAAYLKANSLDANNGNYAYQLGAFYFNQAADLSKVMNNLGTSKEDQVKYNSMKAEQDGYFGKALPLLEKSEQLFSNNKANLTPNEMNLYRQSLEALRSIYVTKNMSDKAQEIKDKLNAL